VQNSSQAAGCGGGAGVTEGKSRKKCFQCGAALNLVEQNMPCRCQGVFCDRHRPYENHECSVNHAMLARAELTQQVRCSAIARVASAHHLPAIADREYGILYVHLAHAQLYSTQAAAADTRGGAASRQAQSMFVYGEFCGSHRHPLSRGASVSLERTQRAFVRVFSIP